MAALKPILASLALLASHNASAGAVSLPLEYAIKASYLYKFAPFVQWPPTAFETAAAPFTICIAGHDPFGSGLTDTVRGQRVNGRPITVRRVETVRADLPCQILYVGGDDTKDALQIVAHAPVLTVTDHVRGGTGGMIQFVMVGGRVRFMIDQAAAHDSGIAISSKLLGLAVSVNR